MSVVQRTHVQRLYLSRQARKYRVAGGLLREREGADLAPIHLEIFGRHPLEADRHLGGGLLLVQITPDTPDHLPEVAPAPAVGLLRVLTRQLQHAHRRQTLPDPPLDVGPVRVDP